MTVNIKDVASIFDIYHQNVASGTYVPSSTYVPAGTYLPTQLPMPGSVFTPTTSDQDAYTQLLLEWEKVNKLAAKKDETPWPEDLKWDF